jgi:hypothetical protein
MAVTVNQLIRRQEGEKQSYPVAAAIHLYQGTLAFVNGAGYAIDNTASGDAKFAGIAISEVDNSSGAAGDLNVELWTDEDVYELTGSGFTQADVGKPAYATDNYTITTTYSANAVRIGRVVEYVSATKLRVKLAPDSTAGRSPRSGRCVDCSHEYRDRDFVRRYSCNQGEHSSPRRRDSN